MFQEKYKLIPLLSRIAVTKDCDFETKMATLRAINNFVHKNASALLKEKALVASLNENIDLGLAEAEKVEGTTETLDSKVIKISLHSL